MSASRIKELEIELEQARQCISFKDSAKLIAENKRLNERINEIMSYVPKIGESSYAQMVKENKKLRESVEFIISSHRCICSKDNNYPEFDCSKCVSEETLREIDNER